MPEHDSVVPIICSGEFKTDLNHSLWALQDVAEGAVNNFEERGIDALRSYIATPQPNTGIKERDARTNLQLLHDTLNALDSVRDLLKIGDTQPLPGEAKIVSKIIHFFAMTRPIEIQQIGFNLDANKNCSLEAFRKKHGQALYDYATQTIKNLPHTEQQQQNASLELAYSGPNAVRARFMNP